MNVAAFRWGRRAAHEPEFVRGLVARSAARGRSRVAQTLDEIIARRVEFLTAYQNAAYARALSRSRRGAARRPRTRAAPGSTVRDRGGGAQPVQADGRSRTNTRLPGSTPTARSRSSLPTQFQSLRPARVPSRAADPRPQAAPDGKPRKSSFGPWMMNGVPACLRRSRACAAPRSTSSATRPSGAWSETLLAQLRGRPRPDRAQLSRRASSRRRRRSPRCRR